MKICHYNEGLAGAVVGEKLYPIGDALMKAGHLKPGHTMLEVIERLANEPAAMKCARFVVQAGSSLPLAQARLLAPMLNPPAIWAAAANYKAHQAEMREKMGSSDRSSLSKDELMAEFFLKPASSIIGPGGTVVLPRISKDVDFECELCAVIGKTARHVGEEQALDCVFGYTICWDFSQRDPWGRGRQNTRNIRKGFDTFTGLGPWIVTRDDPRRAERQARHERAYRRHDLRPSRAHSLSLGRDDAQARSPDHDGNAGGRLEARRRRSLERQHRADRRDGSGGAGRTLAFARR